MDTPRDASILSLAEVKDEVELIISGYFSCVCTPEQLAADDPPEECTAHDGAPLGLLKVQATVERLHARVEELERRDRWSTLYESAPEEARATIVERALASEALQPIIGSWRDALQTAHQGLIVLEADAIQRAGNRVQCSRCHTWGERFVKHAPGCAFAPLNSRDDRR